MTTENKVEVLVVGAGPVGLFAALWLSERGVQARIIDNYQRASLHSYALALHPATLRMLDELGIAEKLIERGQRLGHVVVHRLGNEPNEIDFAAVGDPFPFALVVPQTLLEGVLESRLADNGVNVDWRHQLMSFRESDGTVISRVGRVTENGDDMQLERVASSFLIAADGYNSFTRRALEINLTPVGPPLNFGLLETRCALETRDRVHLVFGARTTDVYWPVPPDRGRWSVQYERGEDTSADSLRSRIHERAPWYPKEREPLEWTTTVSFQRRLAERFGHDRIWLAGDSARFGSPIGVQPMNVGLREARDLARRMADILREGGSDNLLHVYNTERRREWNTLLGIKDRLERGNSSSWSHAQVARLVPSLPASGRDLNRLLEQVGFRLRWKRTMAKLDPALLRDLEP